MAKAGQDTRFKKLYLNYFSTKFEAVYVFSYAGERVDGLPTNVKVISNKYNLHRFIYGLLIPFLNYKFIKKCDVFRAYHILGTMPAVVSKIFFNKKFVFNYGYDYVEFAKIEGKMLQILLIKIISPLAFFTASKIIATTKFAFQFIPRSKSVFIPNGVDTKLFKPYPQKHIRKRLKLLNIGRLEPQKNQINLVKAMKGISADLLILGNGSLENQIIEEAKRLGVNLKILEKIDNSKLPAIYNDADIFVLPSLTEGPVKVLIEAMSCGLPVIGSRARGINEVIINGKTGYFCLTSAQSIKKALNSLIEDKSLRSVLGKNARKLIVDKFDLDKLLEQEVAVMHSL
ncbi:glycosyltransferase family 4 protein [Candidatus Daviesbacteria bacterium]|nr:glycosyltransferase family 4 protein [Candidatus Daviesbacteria bacterium]